MKTVPFYWFASNDHTLDAIGSGYRPLSIETSSGGNIGSTVTLGALFGNAAGFDFLRLGSGAPLSVSTVTASSAATGLQDMAPDMLARTMEMLLGADAPTHFWSIDSVSQNGSLTEAFSQSSAASAIVSASPTVGSDATSGLAHELPSASAVDSPVSILLFVETNGAETFASDVFVTVAPLHDAAVDFEAVQVAAVMPHPIVDPGPLI